MKSREVFALQHWISPRLITGDGFWTFDLDQLFWSIAEAETERDEFHAESITRIVRSEIIEKEVVCISDPEPELLKTSKPLVGQLSLFAEEAV